MTSVSDHTSIADNKVFIPLLEERKKQREIFTDANYERLYRGCQQIWLHA